MPVPVTLVYDLETIPDVALGRKLLKLHDASDLEVIEAMVERRKQQTQGNSDFLPLYLHQVVAISVVVNTPEKVKVWSLGDLQASEKEIITRFFDGLDRYTPILVSWNGCGFDLPVLHYRSLFHGIVSPRYWEIGDKDNAFRWNNYISRYHQRHTDLMDVLAGYQSGNARAPLDEIAQMLGCPGKMGMGGGLVFEKYLAGRLQEIRDYCETDVLNTYLVYLRFQYIRGILSESNYVREQERLHQSLEAMNKPHINEFLAAWEFEPSNSSHASDSSNPINTDE